MHGNESLRKERDVLKKSVDQVMSRANAAEDKIASAHKKAEKLDESNTTLYYHKDKLRKRVAELEKERDEARDAASEPIMHLTHCAERVEKLQGELKNKSIEIKTLYDVIHLLAQEYRPTTVALDGLNLANRYQENIDAGKNGTGAAECQAAQGTEGTGTEA